VHLAFPPLSGLNLGEQLGQTHPQRLGYPIEVDDADVALALSRLDTPRSLAGGGHTKQNEAALGLSPQSEVRLSMRLHSAPRSGNSYKVRLLLGLLGTRCEVVDYDTKGGETHAPGFLKNVNPDGKVPVLELEDGTMLPESGAILYYLAEGTPYLPEQKLDRAQVLRWMFFEQYSLLPNLSRPRLWRMWGVEMTAQRRVELEQLFEQGYRAIGVTEQHLSDHEFFVGERPTVADVALYVYPRLCPQGGYDLEGFPAVRAWLERIPTLPGYVPPPG
jgi:glutathione S-transferase